MHGLGSAEIWMPTPKVNAEIPASGKLSLEKLAAFLSQYRIAV